MTVHQGRSGESRVIKVSDDLYIPLSDFFFLPMPQGPTCKSKVSNGSGPSCSSIQGYYVSSCRAKETPGRVEIHCLKVSLAHPRS